MPLPAAIARPRLHTALLSSALALPLLLAGCGKDNAEEATEHAIEQAAAEHGQDMKVDIKDGKTVIKTTDDKGQAVTYEASQNATTVTTADGSMKMNTGDSAKVPDNYPADGVRYKNLKLDMAMEQDNAFMLNGTTPDPADKVSAALAAQASENGWQSQGNFQQGNMHMQSFTKGNRNLGVTINADNDQTTVSITISP